MAIETETIATRDMSYQVKVKNLQRKTNHGA